MILGVVAVGLRSLQVRGGITRGALEKLFNIIQLINYSRRSWYDIKSIGLIEAAMDHASDFNISV